jgi:hypothetical protein
LFETELFWGPKNKKQLQLRELGDTGTHFHIICLGDSSKKELWRSEGLDSDLLEV